MICSKKIHDTWFAKSIRWIAKMTVKLASTRVISRYYGEIAELSKGPCKRCCGRSVSSDGPK